MKLSNLLSKIKSVISFSNTQDDTIEKEQNNYKPSSLNITKDNFIVVRSSRIELSLLIGIKSSKFLNYKTYLRTILKMNNKKFKDIIIKPAEYLAAKGVQMDKINIIFIEPKGKKTRYVDVNLKEFIKAESNTSHNIINYEEKIKNAIKLAHKL